LSVESLAALNGLDPEGVLLAGTAVRLAGSSEAASAPEGEGPTAEAPVATEETIAPSEVGTIAAENGVPSWFAEAIANQESGFNNGVTSGSDARGVMQILPETWSWIRARSGGVATRPGIGGLERARGSADASLAAG
jgi:soluble lytic murein transglycosylase-like protein